MKKILFLIICCCAISTLKAQYKDTQWCFGDSCGIDFSNPANPVTFKTHLKNILGSSSIADANNNLIYYIGGVDTILQSILLNRKKIFSRTNQIINNGDSIIGNGAVNKFFASCSYPGVPNQFIVFSTSLGSAAYVTYFKMDSDYTNGTVLIKNQLLLNFYCSGLQIIRHANGRDWWIITKDFLNLNDSFITFLATPNGLQGPYYQKIGTQLSFVCNHPYLVASNKGDQLAYITSSGLIEKYDFDRCTGLLSNAITISTEKPVQDYPAYQYGCFSTNDSILYITSIINSNPPGPYSGNNLYQINLYSTPYVLDSIYQFPTMFSEVGNLKLGSDNKIYIAGTNAIKTSTIYNDSDYTMYNMNLSVINQPNKLGQACDLQPFSFYLGGSRTYIDLPNNPNYNLGSLAGSGCDTLTSVVAPVEVIKGVLNLNYYSPWQKLFVNAQQLKGKTARLQLYDSSGRLVYSKTEKITPPYFSAEVDCNAFTTGIYIVHLRTETESLSGKFIKN